MLADFSLNYNKSVNVVGRDRIELATTAFGQKLPFSIYSWLTISGLIVVTQETLPKNRL